MNSPKHQNEVIRLPLWKSAFEEMQKQGVHYGQTWPAEFFETYLRCKRDDMRFGLAISEIRRELEKEGFYLSGRGQNGNQFVVLQPENNVDVMAQYQRAAADALKRGVILGTNTRLDTLKDAERKRHESMLERMAVKSILLSRSGRIKSVLHRHAPALLDRKPNAA